MTKPKPLTFIQARALCRSQGFTLTRRPDREFRLSRPDWTEAQTYYTNDLEDAWGTAQAEGRRLALISASTQGVH